MVGALLGGVARSREKCADAFAQSSRFSCSGRYCLSDAQELIGCSRSDEFVSIDLVEVDENGGWTGMKPLLSGVWFSRGKRVPSGGFPPV